MRGGGGGASQVTVQVTVIDGIVNKKKAFTAHSQRFAVIHSAASEILEVGEESRYPLLDHP